MKKIKARIAFAAIILGLVVSPAVALSETGSMRSSAELAKSASTSLVKTVMVVGIEDPKFVPQVIHLEVNDSIRFINQDGKNGGLAHDIVSVDAQSRIPNGIFHGSLLNVGDTFTVKFLEPGVYYFTDSIYPQMSGIIVVS